MYIIEQYYHNGNKITGIKNTFKANTLEAIYKLLKTVKLHKEMTKITITHAITQFNETQYITIEEIQYNKR